MVSPARRIEVVIIKWCESTGKGDNGCVMVIAVVVVVVVVAMVVWVVLYALTD